jgi:hypothetical protein
MYLFYNLVSYYSFTLTGCCSLNAIAFVCYADIVRPCLLLYDLIYVRLSVGYLLCWILWLVRLQITVLTVAGF